MRRQPAAPADPSAPTSTSPTAPVPPAARRVASRRQADRQPEPAAPSAGSRSARASSRSRGRRQGAPAPAPLGSLTQAQHRHGQLCRNCGSDRVTQLTMELTDGTPVQFLSCHVCETRVWQHEGAVMDVGTVLSHTTRRT